jgi:hypothetical protein
VELLAARAGMGGKKSKRGKAKPAKAAGKRSSSKTKKPAAASA